MITETFITGIFQWVTTVLSWLANHNLINYKGFQLSFLAADIGLLCAYLILKLLLGSIFHEEEGDDDI